MTSVEKTLLIFDHIHVCELQCSWRHTGRLSPILVLFACNLYFFSVALPGSGSDYAPFRDRIGLPCVDIRYTWDSVSTTLYMPASNTTNVVTLLCPKICRKFCNIIYVLSAFQRVLKLSAYPMYHSVYETFFLVDQIMDRGFKVSLHKLAITSE